MDYDKPFTMNDLNNEGLRECLSVHRRKPAHWNSYWQKRLEEHLETRRRYRSDKPMKVWIADFGDGETVTFESKEAIGEYNDNGYSLKVKVGKMTGREFGKLPVWDW